MKEYIERKALIAEYARQHIGPPGKARELIATFPAADVREVVRGEWMYEEKELKTGVIACFHTCTACGYHTNLFVIKSISSHPYNFCPNCGADMREPPKEKIIS